MSTETERMECFKDGIIVYDKKIWASVSRPQVASLIEITQGKEFRVTFRKLDGNLRVMQARTNIRHNLRGGKPCTAPHLITLFDVSLREYRHVAIDRIEEVKIEQVHYRVIE